MTATRKFGIFIVIALVCACALSVCMPAASGGAAYAAETGGAEATTAGIYGGIDTDELWYFGGSELNLSEIRTHVARSVLPVLEANNAEPVVIAIVDTGLDLGNDVFGDVLLRGEDNAVLGYNAYYASKGNTGMISDITDESEDKHGTAVASIIAVLIKETGLEDYIKIYPVKASFPTGASEGGVNEFNRETVRLGIEQAVSEEIDADVINLSLCSTTTSETEWRTDAALQAVISDAAQTATVVAAAGNNSTSSTSHYYYPAAYNGVVGVMAHDADGYYDTTDYGAAYDVFAPGDGIMVSTENGVYRTNGSGTSGTSMAAPIVSFAAALLRLSLTAENLAGDLEMPRNTVITRMITGLAEDDATVTARDGNEYKKLDILKLISEDINDIDYGWQPVTGLSVTAERNGTALSTGAAVTVQTIRETGQGRSYIEFTADLTPEGDTDPALADAVEWTLVEYTTNDDGEEEQASETALGTGAGVGYLFDTAGSYGVRASLTTGEGEAAQTFTSEFRLTVSWQSWNGSRAYIVSTDYISSAAYTGGTGGAVSTETVIYGRGSSVTLTVTTIEDVDCETVNWYVNGTIAGTGRTFTFEPSGMPGKDYTVTARVVFSDDSVSYVQNGFTVHHRSWAANPYFAILWTALGIGVIVGGVFLGRSLNRRKAARLAAAESESVLLGGQEKKDSPIRKK